MRRLEDMRIGVLAGGPSSEREISLKSGASVCAALKSRGLNAVLVDVSGDPRSFFGNIDIDVAFIALHGGAGEDGTVQGILEKFDIPYTGSSSRSSGVAIDKIASKKLFERACIRVPRYAAVSAETGSMEFVWSYGFPAVVKPAREGSSVGLTVVSEPGGLAAAIGKALKHGGYALVEEFIPGRELTVGVVDGQALPVVEIGSKCDIYDYNAKYVDTETIYTVPAMITAERAGKAQETALAAHMALGCRHFSRVDMRMTAAGEIYVLEVNTIPGLTERSLLPKAARAAGIEFPELCVKFIEMAINKKGDDDGARQEKAGRKTVV